MQGRHLPDKGKKQQDNSKLALIAGFSAAKVSLH